MQILLQNRARFYEILLPRISDQVVRARLEAISKAEAESILNVIILDKSIINIEKLSLLDPLCKPELGRKWGRTSISLEEALGRASRFEELILLACRAQLEVRPDSEASKLSDVAQQRLALLLSLIDDLRYHRIRLVEMP